MPQSLHFIKLKTTLNIKKLKIVFDKPKLIKITPSSIRIIGSAPILTNLIRFYLKIIQTKREANKYSIKVAHREAL